MSVSLEFIWDLLSKGCDEGLFGKQMVVKT